MKKKLFRLFIVAVGLAVAVHGLLSVTNGLIKLVKERRHVNVNIKGGTIVCDPDLWLLKMATAAKAHSLVLTTNNGYISALPQQSFKSTMEHINSGTVPKEEMDNLNRVIQEAWDEGNIVVTNSNGSIGIQSPTDLRFQPKVDHSKDDIL